VTTLSIYEIIAIIAVLVVIVIGFALLVLRRLREQKAKLLHELNEPPRLRSDRAFNRIAMARREASLMNNQGSDVSRALEELARAQAAFDRRQFDQAYELAQTAHESMVAARQRGPIRSSQSLFPTQSSAPAVAPPPAPPVGPQPPSPGAAPSPPPPEGGRIPKNRAESQFQLRLLAEAMARPRPAGGSALQSAAALAQSAHSAFDRGDYTEAFRLALKARRQLGESVESLPLTPTRSPAPPSTTEAGGKVPDALSSAEDVATAERCPSCGYPTLAADAFCRGCGAPRGPMTCPTCGAERAVADTFCGRCGTRFE